MGADKTDKLGKGLLRTLFNKAASVLSHRSVQAVIAVGLTYATAGDWMALGMGTAFGGLMYAEESLRLREASGSSLPCPPPP